MRTGCSFIFNLTKRGAVLVLTKLNMAQNHEVNAKKSVHYRKNLRLDGEDMEQANVMLVVQPQTEALEAAFRRMGRQGDTVDTLLKLLDKEAIAETPDNDDGTYRATVFTTEELRSFFAY